MTGPTGLVHGFKIDNFTRYGRYLRGIPSENSSFKITFNKNVFSLNYHFMQFFAPGILNIQYLKHRAYDFGRGGDGLYFVTNEFIYN